MSYEDDNESASDHDFGDLFGSEDEASDIDDGRSQSSAEGKNSPVTAPVMTTPPPTKSNDLDNLFGSDDESESGDESRQTLKHRRFVNQSFFLKHVN